MSGTPFHIFGIRHHGPGCAKTLARALNSLRPDCILIEGPPEANDLIHLVAHEQMQTPVALLVHVDGDASKSVFDPFAEFSPEWQAMLWGVKHQAKVKFMDLPAGISIALGQEDLDDDPQIDLMAFDASDADTPSAHDLASFEAHADLICADPITHLAVAAGYADGESWWNHVVEERGDGEDLFEAIAEAMRAVRSEIAHSHNNSAAEQRREALREAHMRQTMRQAQKDGFKRIAVICGAWHLPALEAKITAKADTDLLKGLPKVKTVATWVPWTYRNLAASSGYGAGIDSPGWYEFLWHHDPAQTTRAIGWLSRIAGLLRSSGIDCSSAHIIEAARLADTLASLRGRPTPGLEEIEEAVKSTIFMGNGAQLDLIRNDLSIGHRMGQVPDTVPMVPLQKDLELTQKRLRFKPEAFSKTHELDLRNENDLARSHMLHRVKMLGIPWGSARDSGGGKGTFKEVWDLQWTPQCAISVIEASQWGLTLESAASRKIVEVCARSEDLSTLAKAIDTVLLADLKEAVVPVSTLLEERASLTGDVREMLSAVAPLATVHRYGSVRNFDTEMVGRVLDGVVTRASIGLLCAASGINEEVAVDMRAAILGAHGAIGIRESKELSEGWRRALSHVARSEGADALLRGLACRLVFDQREMPRDEVDQQLWLNLSASEDPLQASRWLDGFLNRNALVLLHDDEVWGLVNDWVTCLPSDAFVKILPLVRRTFSDFESGDRQRLSQLAAKGKREQAQTPVPRNFDAQRSAMPLATLANIFGVSA